jgi:hypothetical protein
LFQEKREGRWSPWPPHPAGQHLLPLPAHPWMAHARGRGGDGALIGEQGEGREGRAAATLGGGGQQRLPLCFRGERNDGGWVEGKRKGWDPSFAGGVEGL